MTTIEMQPPKTTVSPLTWLRQNLLNSWFNILLTVLIAWVLFALLRSALGWALTEARWGVITSNLTLFMIGQYPRDQIWRVWAVIHLLAALVGLSWGAWRAAARGFALIALGATGSFSLVSLLLGRSAWHQWLLALGILLAVNVLARRLPRARSIAGLGWILYFPLALLIIAGLRWLPGLPVVPLNLWGGLLLTLVLTVVGNLGALPLGVLLALGRRSNLPAVRIFSTTYIEVIRGVPLITILYMADILLPLFLPQEVRPDRVIRAMIGLILFEAAYQAENVRGGLQSIGRGQYEAAHALGLNTALTTLLVILPQALRAVIPALLNSFISLFKDTSLVAIIGLFDLLRVGRSVLAQSDWLGTHREVFLFAFLIYWGISLTFSYGSNRLEEALRSGKD